ncbi:MAG: hypothetical protein K9G46_13275 [Flavobacteriales bacterium]|nr:hypothetical protein [Flavobacteriales bacterium]
MSFLKKVWNHQIVQRTLYFFPLRLLVLHFKKNYILLFFWVALGSFATGAVGQGYGVPYLFWDPEYMGRVDFWSFMILGFALGGFIMAFHISSYIQNAYRFPFLATVSKPFFKYSLNNSIIPGIFLALYFYKIAEFQFKNELFLLENNLQVSSQIAWDMAGLVSGILLFMIPGHSYFLALSRNIFKVIGVSEEDLRKKDKKKKKTIQVLMQKNLEWRHVNAPRESDYEWKVVTYMVNWFKIGLTRDSDHYDKEVVQKVFRQNHMIAVVFEMVAVITFLIFGGYRETPTLNIPAGAIIFLTSTMVLMLTSAIHSALRGWSTIFLIVTIIGVHFLVYKGVLQYESRAYGMNYDDAPAIYNLDSLTNVQQSFTIYEKDVNHHHEILKKWKLKNTDRKSDKPKLVLVCVTGGGARSALWSYKVMQVADSITNGELMKHTQLISGASGGMFGLAYWRELYLRSQTDSTINLNSQEYVTRMGMDLLNPITTSLAVNDWFIRFQKFRDGTYIYSKDRGYALEKQFNDNTLGIVDKRLGDYAIPEQEALIPMMLFSPSIINDGRSLYICSQPIAHLTFNHPNILKGQALQSAVEFRRLLKNQDADNVWFSSVLRMNATFPFISPAVSLPSDPVIEVMDAGFRDTYGASLALKHLYAIRKWVEQNTSGVIILQIRDSKKIEPIGPNEMRSLFKMMSNPLGHIYDNLFVMQDYNNDDLTVYAQDWLNTDLEVIDLELTRPELEDISLSWHLTTKEKTIIERSAYNEKNQAAMKHLNELLLESK